MRKRFWLLAGFPLLFTACTEQDATYNGAIVEGDTAFMAAPEAPQARMVLMEEFTGVKCPNCPAGHVVIAGLRSTYPGRVAAIGYYANGQPLAFPLELTTDDFRTDDATTIAADVMNGIEYLPSGAVDRIVFDGTKLLGDRGLWTSAVSNRLSVPPIVNLTINSDFNEDTRKATIKIHAAFTSAYSGGVALSVALLESGMIQPQEYAIGSDIGIDTNYTHREVMRDMITSATGDLILNGVTDKTAGQVYERTIIYDVPAGLNTAECEIVAFLHAAGSSGDDKQVLQAAEAPLQ